MPISLRTMRLRPGEERVERPSLELEPLLLGGQTYAPTAGAVDVTVTVQRATTGYALRLRFVTAVAGPCMRCLEHATVPLDVDVREYHDLEPAGDEELISDYVVDDVVALESWARDAVALTLPDPILCRPDCAGLCPVCGRNLNDEPHVHEPEPVDPRWAALGGLELEEA